ncbi:hypothetical protein ADK57_42555 [Streptomyces sp. MMG1533]|nr:hypothetical protein ADK57_42555 [Streptomyces sp. MMG1533]
MLPEIRTDDAALLLARTRALAAQRLVFGVVISLATPATEGLCWFRALPPSTESGRRCSGPCRAFFLASPFQKIVFFAVRQWFRPLSGESRECCSR